MKTVEYDLKTNPHVGKLECPRCVKDVPAWKSSGMSELRPHFYCSKCSNAIHRKADQAKTWTERGGQQLKDIEATLPSCACGGRFVPGANPKCPTCGYEFRHQGTPLDRLADPHLILVDGAVKYGDDGPEYRIRITK